MCKGMDAFTRTIQGITTMIEESVREMTREELLVEIQDLKNEIAALKARERILENSCQFKDGQIEGLKFAIRCNGVSGNEVQ